MKQFYISSVQYLLDAEMDRVLVNVGVNKLDWKALTGSVVWTRDQRVRIQRTLDSVLYGICDMTGMPRIDLPAELYAAVVAATVAPTNWMIAAGWQQGLKSAKDLMEAEETVQVDRVPAGKMIALIVAAHAAMSADEEAFDAIKQGVTARLSKDVA